MSPAAESPQKKVCILASGGIDSSLLIVEALNQNYQVYPLFVAMGFIWEEAEQFWLNRLLQELPQKNLKSLQTVKTDFGPLFPRHWAITGVATPDTRSRDETVELPGRNLLLLSHAALFCQSGEIPEIWIGTLAANPFPDARPEFFSAYEAAANRGLRFPIRIRAPFSSMKKEQLIDKYPDFNYSLIFSCLNPRDKQHCESCNKCEERKRFLSLDNRQSTIEN